VAKGKAANAAQARAAKAEQKSSWPKAGLAAVTVPGSGRAKPTAGGLLTADAAHAGTTVPVGEGNPLRELGLTPVKDNPTSYKLPKWAKWTSPS
jgi:hypothetical protein